MTGYGRGEASVSGVKVTVELSAVNRRQMEVAMNLPRELDSLESLSRELIHRQVARGRITAKTALEISDPKWGPKVQVNWLLAKEYAAQLQRLAKEIGSDEPVRLDHLLKVPGVLQPRDEMTDASALWPTLEKAMTKALQALNKMRRQEGDHLRSDLEKRIAALEAGVARIRKRAPGMVTHYRKQLIERIQSAQLEVPGLDDERLMREITYFADRSDISEELTRLESHFKQFTIYAKSKEPVGRTLDFLAQEINREINTIGSKAADAEISKEVVKLKAELEKFREQVQNVE